ncbi:MAG: phage holin family protein [Bacteroidaceae bacterium]|nr:phage holin family protein [Bacteroidaceae bacterium]
MKIILMSGAPFLLDGTREQMLLWAAVAAVVLMALVGDLCAGLYKAKLRGDARTSYALKRSVYKFLTYEGAVLVGGCIDLLMHFAHFFRLIGIASLDNVPLVAILVGIFLCVVELLSIREKADAKTHKTMKKVEDAASKLITEQVADRLIDALLERAAKKIKNEKD